MDFWSLFGKAAGPQTQTDLYGNPVRGGNLPAGMVPSGEMSAYAPSLRERGTDAMRGLFSDNREGQQKAERLSNWLETVSPYGVATGMYDAGRAGAQGDMLPAAAMAAMAVMPGPDPERQAVTQGIRAYHGSPHSFDKFDMSKIGTGEGAQAYGHGLYFADSEGVAKSYRDNLSKAVNAEITVGGKPLHWVDRSVISDYPGLATGKLSLDDAIAQAKSMGRNSHASLFEDIKQKGGIKQPGSMYEVNINADPNSFLDWDKPLSEQPKTVQDAINRVGRDPAPYGLDKISSDMRPIEMQSLLKDPGAVERIKGHGVPGIKYLDAGSRTKGDGSRNYVVFDDKLVEILRKYGLAGLLPAGAGAAAMSQQSQHPTDY